MQVVLCVTNDMGTDRRVCRVAHSLMRYGQQVTVVARRSKRNMKLQDFSFKIHRMGLLFNKGPFFYAEYNLRLLLHLLFIHADVLVANDLDTLPAVYIASRVRKKILLYDSHEYFTEVPELIGRKLVRKIWQMFEYLILPKVQHAYTVSDPIARAYNQKYGMQMRVIRNVPWRIPKIVHPETLLKTGDEKIILYQGSVNRGRGLELAIQAIRHMRNAKLIIIGTGDVEPDLKRMVTKLGIQDKVLFQGAVPPDDLIRYTIQADIGISLEEDAGLNYCYSLPNKLFDYIQAEIPVLVSDLPEMASVVNRYEIGEVNKTNDPEVLASVFHEMLHNGKKRQIWKEHLSKAAKELCWENEELRLIKIYRNATNDPFKKSRSADAF